MRLCAGDATATHQGAGHDLLWNARSEVLDETAKLKADLSERSAQTVALLNSMGHATRTFQARPLT
jgi:hypothetical protein